jgi:enoyl-CoA hydratase
MLDKLNQAFNQAENAQAILVLTGQLCMSSGGYDLKVMRYSMAVAMA